ncbi:MAG TPA: hypothetical protein VGR71_01380 [Nitrospira sp.]|nr:hypothetical protein [Nitrospira sp.]
MRRLNVSMFLSMTSLSELASRSLWEAVIVERLQEVSEARKGVNGMLRRDHNQPAALEARRGVRPGAGTVRECVHYRDELARHRVITADGLDYVVATLSRGQHEVTYTTVAYPVVGGYLVMMRQAICCLQSEDWAEARRRHAQLVDVLATAGTRVVKARRHSAEWLRAERIVDGLTEDIGLPVGPQTR